MRTPSDPYHYRSPRAVYIEKCSKGYMVFVITGVTGALVLTWPGLTCNVHCTTAVTLIRVIRAKERSRNVARSTCITWQNENATARVSKRRQYAKAMLRSIQSPAAKKCHSWSEHWNLLAGPPRERTTHPKTPHQSRPSVKLVIVGQIVGRRLGLARTQRAPFPRLRQMPAHSCTGATSPLPAARGRRGRTLEGLRGVLELGAGGVEAGGAGPGPLRVRGRRRHQVLRGGAQLDAPAKGTRPVTRGWTGRERKGGRLDGAEGGGDLALQLACESQHPLNGLATAALCDPVLALGDRLSRDHATFAVQATRRHFDRVFVETETLFRDDRFQPDPRVIHLLDDGKREEWRAYFLAVNGDPSEGG